VHRGIGLWSLPQPEVISATWAISSGCRGDAPTVRWWRGWGSAPSPD